MRVTPYFNGASRQDVAGESGISPVHTRVDLVIEALDEFAPGSGFAGICGGLCSTNADYVLGAAARN
jgi:hypothetical protein